MAGCGGGKVATTSGGVGTMTKSLRDVVAVRRQRRRFLPCGAASFLLLAVGAVVLVMNAVVYNVEGAAYVCGPFNSADVSCSHTIAVGDTFQLNCTNTVDTKQPGDLLTGNADTIKTCQSSTARTAVDPACAAGEDKLLKDVPGISISNPSATGWTFKNDGYTGTSTIILNGSCKAAAGNGGYFNATLSPTTTAAPSAGDGAKTSFGLVVATSVALMGLVMFRW